jgi:hypothetical protein
VRQRRCGQTRNWIPSIPARTRPLRWCIDLQPKWLEKHCSLGIIIAQNHAAVKRKSVEKRPNVRINDHQMPWNDRCGCRERSAVLGLWAPATSWLSSPTYAVICAFPSRARAPRIASSDGRPGDPHETRNRQNRRGQIQTRHRGCSLGLRGTAQLREGLLPLLSFPRRHQVAFLKVVFPETLGWVCCACRWAYVPRGRAQQRC